MNYSEAIDFLYGLRLFGTKLGLENTFALARLCGNPQDGLRFVHVAGTNGKGSVCASLESIYRHAGLRVGLFTSPHLVSFTERIQVNRHCIPEDDVSQLTSSIIERLGQDREQWALRPTFFEFVTILGLLYFAEQRCDLVIWETGLGGRLDATNIVNPLASVITNIQFDHQQWLGSTLREIASEKAGIIKPGIPVITATEEGEALETIREAAQQTGSPCIVVERDSIEPRLRGKQIPLLGEHQRINAAVALAVVEALQGQIPVADEAVAAGLAQTSWAGRLQVFRKGATTFLLDGAHNPDGARALARSLNELFPNREITLVFGIFRDKAWREMCTILVPTVARVFLVPVQSERSADAEEVKSFCLAAWPKVEIRTFASSSAAIEEGLRFPFVVVAGSLHLVGEVMQALGVSEAVRSERELNEWDAGGEGARR